MNNLEKAARQALEALELHAKQYPYMQKGYTVDAIADLHQALEQPKQEPCNPSCAPGYCYCEEMAEQPQQKPVAWMYDWKTEGVTVTDWVTSDKNEAYDLTKGCTNIRPLYTEPPQRKPLTDEQIKTNWPNIRFDFSEGVEDATRDPDQLLWRSV